MVEHMTLTLQINLGVINLFRHQYKSLKCYGCQLDKSKIKISFV